MINKSKHGSGEKNNKLHIIILLVVLNLFPVVERDRKRSVL
jgi:hypothetical protein